MALCSQVRFRSGAMARLRSGFSGSKKMCGAYSPSCKASGPRSSRSFRTSAKTQMQTRISSKSSDSSPPRRITTSASATATIICATNSIFNLLETAGISAQELVRSRKFMNISTQPDVSHWEVFRAPANRVLPNESSNRSLLEFVQIDRFRSNVGRNIADAKDGLTTLAKLPTARLERLLAEHVDSVNYRLDSWQTAL